MFVTGIDHYTKAKQLSGSDCAIEDGTYDLGTMRTVNFSKGYQVTFQQRKCTEYTKSFYNALVDCIGNYTGSNVYVGVYEGQTELSFHTLDELTALDIAIEFHQDSYFDWEACDIVEHQYYSLRRKMI